MNGAGEPPGRHLEGSAPPLRGYAGWLVFGLGVIIVAALLPFAAGLLGAAVLYVACAPAHRALSPRLGPRAAAALVLLGALFLVLLPGALLITVAVDQAPEILRSLTQSPTLERVARLRIGGLEVGEEITAASGALLTWVSRQAFVAFGGLARTVLNLVIAFFGLYYLLVARAGTWERARLYLPFSPGNAQLLRARFHRVTEATLLGIALTALLQGSLIGAGFRLVGLAHPLFWGMLAALASVLPVVGSALVWLPGVVALAALERWGAALVLALIGGGISSNVDNLIRLVVYKRVSDIHPMITLVGAFAGVKYMGVIGVLLGPLAIIYFFELLRVYREERGRFAAPGDAA